MPDLHQSLRNHDIGHLRIVAGLWGLELEHVEFEETLDELTSVLLDQKLADEIVESLPQAAKSALAALLEAGGKIPIALFSRRFGEIREIGTGRRDREMVYLEPVSASEALFYRALVAKDFFDTPTGAQEFAYIPDDLKNVLKPPTYKEPTDISGGKIAPHRGKHVPDGSELPGRPASPKEREHPLPTCNRLLDDATTLLAALRMGRQPPETSIPTRVVSDFLSAAKIIVKGIPQIEPVRDLLKAARQKALQKLFDSWKTSETFNELRQLSGLIMEGEWANQPLVTREFMLTLLEEIPSNQWWSLSAFVRFVKEKYPDFQRPAGDYDSWFIRRESDGTYLRGIQSWEEVDGALIRYLITGPLFWLGVLDLATPAEAETITAFRITDPATQHPTAETTKLHISSQGTISVPRLSPRSARYQIARFCEWDQERDDEYRYRVTTKSLKEAGKQGLKVSQLLSLLARNSATDIPPSFINSLKRWETKGTEARLETRTILQVSSPEVLEELRKSKASRFLGESLGPVTVVVKPGAQPKVLSALSEMGLLAEEEHEE
jgi:hypothetical protein